MSSYWTSSPSTEQTRLYLIRPPSVSCTWWNRMSCSSVAEYSFTAMLTSPKETAPFQIDRTATSWPRSRGTHGWSRSQDRRCAPRPAARDGYRAESSPRRGDRRAAVRHHQAATLGERAVSVAGGSRPWPAAGGRRRRTAGRRPGHHRHRQRGQPGGPGRGRVAEHQPVAVHCARQNGQVTSSPMACLTPPWTRISSATSASPGLCPGSGERCPQRAGDRVLGDRAGRSGRWRW